MLTALSRFQKPTAKFCIVLTFLFVFIGMYQYKIGVYSFISSALSSSAPTSNYSLPTPNHSLKSSMDYRQTTFSTQVNIMLNLRRSTFTATSSLLLLTCLLTNIRLLFLLMTNSYFHSCKGKWKEYHLKLLQYIHLLDGKKRCS